MQAHILYLALFVLADLLFNLSASPALGQHFLIYLIVDGVYSFFFVTFWPASDIFGLLRIRFMQKIVDSSLLRFLYNFGRLVWVH